MTDYTITTNFGAKDSLPSGNAGKVIKGEEFTTEFTNIQTAVNTKADTAGDTFTGVVNFSADVAVNTNTLFVDVSEDKVGIGTTSPQAPLHVHGDINLGNSAGADAADVEIASLNFYNRDTSGSAPNNASIIRAYSHSHTGSGGYLTFATSFGGESEGADATEKMRIDASGNVGIGTSSPESGLHVKNNTGVKVSDSDSTRHLKLTPALSDGTPAIVESTSANGLRLNASGTDAPLQLYSNNTERMRIDSSGKLLLNTSTHTLTDSEMVVASEYSASGTTTGGITLSSRQSGSWRNSGIFANGANLTFTTGDTGLNGAQASSERMRIDSSGNVLVGTTSTSTSTTGHALFAGSADNGVARHVASSIEALQLGRNTTNGRIVQFYKDGTPVGTISVTSSATAYNTSSDERLKENIADSADAGSKVDAIQIRQFDWKADGSHQDYGVIAQELINVTPEAVSEGDTEEDMMGVDYSKLVPMLIKEVQSLRSRVAELENV